MHTNCSMPPSAVIPEIPYPNVREAADWLCRVFAFKERLQIGNHRAQLVFGDGSLVVTQGGETNPSFSVMVPVEDIDSHHDRVKQAGAKIISPPTDYPYGERQYVVEDLGGHRWTFSQTISDVDPQTWGGSLIQERDQSPEEFIRSYEVALVTQDWNQVEPLIHPDVCVTFSNGAVHRGKAEVQRAFERNFSLIKDEEYSIRNVHWVLRDDRTAVYLFDFSWSGIINDKPAGGSGGGTSVLTNANGKWLLMVEHLGPRAS